MSRHAVKIDESNFQTDVLDSSTPVLVDFWAEWCPPCKMIAPLLEQLAVEYQGRLTIGKLDADENQDIISRYGIMSMPTVILFKAGQPVETIVGYQPKEKITRKLAPHLS